MIDFHGQPAISLRAPDGAGAIMLLQGGQLVSWTDPRGEEQLYLSELADYTPGKAVRGGVPIAFPQFGRRGPLAMHGFARNCTWELVSERNGDDYALATLRLQDSDATRALWPHRFTLEMTAHLSHGRLDMELDVTNTDDAPFSFTCALHTYLRVREVEHATLEGLRGLFYLCNATGKEGRESGTELQVESEVNRIYFNAKRPLLLRDGRRTLGIQAEEMPDVVVWNPWDKHGIADLPASGFRRYLCVEAACVGEPVQLAPGQSWWGRQTLVTL